MKKVRFWIVSPSERLVIQESSNLASARIELNEWRKTVHDATICTNECSTTFLNGMVFMDGKLYKRTI